MKKSQLLIAFIIPIILVSAYNRADSLRGSLSSFKTCYDVESYELDLAINFSNHSIAGFNRIQFNTIEDFEKIQLDLFSNMEIDSIMYDGLKLEYLREHNAVFISFPWKVLKGSVLVIDVFYHGVPREAVNAPWDGGFSWEKDTKNIDWLGVSCEGVGASLWWPCKDHLSDEPESMKMHFTVPSHLMAISNGRLIGKHAIGRDKMKYSWELKNNINNYNVTVNVANYVHLKDRFVGENNKVLDLDYYVLRGNKDTAQKHFVQVQDILSVFEKYFGPYPFYEDGYKLVETSYWGMEHQSCISYGNDYRNNEWDFDFIILHETAHEWFGNSLSMTDAAEMWLHEAFATYAEALFVEEKQDYFESVKYLISKKANINNDFPMLGQKGVNYNWEDIDIYTKGAWLLHSLRSVMDNDETWFDILRSFSVNNKKSAISSEDFIELVKSKSGIDFDYFFNHYLKIAHLPKLECKLDKGKKGKQLLSYRWSKVSDDFKMPVKVSDGNGGYYWIDPSTKWKTKEIKRISASEFKPATHLFLIDFELIK